MKKVFLRPLFGTMMAVVLLASCAKNENKPGNGGEPLASIDSDLPSKNVAIIQYGYKSLPRKNNTEQFALKMEIKSFDASTQIDQVYKINGREFNDNGAFNDEVAHDGIFTSVESFQKPNGRNLSELDKVIVHKAPSFLYDNDLNDYIGAKKPGFGITVGCQTRWVKCPGTSWYNESWFGASCIEFYNCYVEVGFGW